MMEQAVADLLDETIQAFTVFDVERLQLLERKMNTLAKGDLLCDEKSIRRMQEKRRLLGLMLQSCAVNLDALHRLHDRNTREPWAH